MVKMKQTACGGPSRQVGMQALMFGDKPEEGQFAEVPEEEEDEENWPDLNAPHRGEEIGEPSKPTGKEGDKPTPQAKEQPAQAKGGATATPAQPSQHPHRTQLINPKITKQVLAQMTQVSKNM